MPDSAALSQWVRRRDDQDRRVSHRSLLTFHLLLLFFRLARQRVGFHQLFPAEILLCKSETYEANQERLIQERRINDDTGLWL